MKKKDASFWSEIKTLDERLSREPDSFCFARLSEIYLKVGLVADALHTARHGVARHPGYLAGQRALAMACNASNLRDESRGILERVTAAMPEDLEAQKLLATLYVDAGDTASAMRTYATVLDFRPDDVPSRKQLEILQQGGIPESAGTKPVEPAVAEAAPLEVAAPAETAEDEEILELTEDDIVYDEELEEEEEYEEEAPAAAVVAEIAEPEHHDPLSTQTLAELYEQQGFITKALNIYRTILADDPGNTRLLEKIALLEQQESPAAEPAVVEEAELQPEMQSEAEPDVEPEEETVAFIESTEQIAPAAFEAFEEIEAVAAPLEPSVAAFPAEETVDFAGAEELAAPAAAFDDMSPPPASQDLAPLVHKEADNVVGTLDGWLENIRRIKACR